jgi:hypothetical protein
MATLLDSQVEAEATQNANEAVSSFSSHRDMVTAEVLAHASSVVCLRCKLACDPFKAIIKSKSTIDVSASKFVRRLCNNVANILQRNMQWPPPMFSQLDDDSQKQFWLACQEMNRDDSRFQYSKVRATLAKTLATRKTVQDAVETFSEPKPLSVWSKAGYNIEDIQQKGKCEDHPVFGQVYSFPMKRVSTKTTLETVEEHLQKAEQKVKGKQLSDDDDGFDGLDSSGEDDLPRKKNSKGSKKKKPSKGSNTDKAAARAEAARVKKEKAKIQKTNAATHTLAAKALVLLTAPHTDCTMAYDTMTGSLNGRFPLHVVTQIVEARDELAQLKGKAAEVLGKSKKCDEEIELDFDQKQLQLKVSNAKTALKAFHDMMKLVNKI